MQRRSEKFLLLMLAIAFVSLFVTLGTWQFNRGEAKTEILSAEISAQDQAAITPRLPLEKAAQWRYRKITLRGKYKSDWQFLLDNQVRDRVVGYNVITVFHNTTNNRYVLVDRGWVAAGESRDQFPEIRMTSDPVSVTGVVYVPFGEAYKLGGVNDGENSSWPMRVQYIDYEALGRLAGIELEPFTLRLGPKEKEGYRRDWASASFPPERHYGYAVQWYALALTTFVLYVIYLWKTRQRK